MGVRRLLAVAALAVGGAALLARAPEATPPARPNPRPVVQAPEPFPPAPMAAAPCERAAEAVPAQAAPRPAGAPVPRATDPVASTLEHRLELSAPQRAQIEDILAQRRDEIDRCHLEIRASGVFRPREWERRVGDILAASYGRIASVLDSRQAMRFGELVAQRAIADPVEFEPDPGMVILD